METLNENDLFQSSDMSLVAALLCNGAKIWAVERNNGPRATFLIQREPGLDELVRAFWSHELRVDPASYFAAIKEAKTRLYSADTY